MKSPANKWELWTDGSYRLTSKSDLLHLIVWHEDALKPSPGWHYRVIQIGGAELRFSKKSSPTQDVARRLCMKAALDVLTAASRGMAKAQ